MHDRVAELRGLRAEHDRYTTYGQKDRAAEVDVQIERVAGEVEADIEALEDRAATLAEQGQDIPAAEAAAAARQLRADLEELGAAAVARPSGRGSKRNAAAGRPPHTTGKED